MAASHSLLHMLGTLALSTGAHKMVLVELGHFQSSHSLAVVSH